MEATPARVPGGEGGGEGGGGEGGGKLGDGGGEANTLDALPPLLVAKRNQRG